MILVQIMMLDEAIKADIESKTEKVLADGETFQIVQKYDKINNFEGYYIYLVSKPEREKGSSINIAGRLHVHVAKLNLIDRSHGVPSFYDAWQVTVRNFVSYKEGRVIYSSRDGITPDDISTYVNHCIQKIIKAGVLKMDLEAGWNWIRKSALRMAKSCFPGFEMNGRLYYNTTFDPYRD